MIFIFDICLFIILIQSNISNKANSHKSHYQKFDIPSSWVWTTLGDIFSMQAGKNIQASELKECSEKTPYPCYGGNGIRGYLPKYSHEGLYPIIGRQGALCGNINMASGKFYATEHAVVVDYFANTEPLMWRYFLEFLNLNQYATATAQPGLSVAKIEEVPIPLPPIQEQTRIIKAVENWFGYVTLLEKNTISLNERIATIKFKILELAMQGKLVPQDPTDEPAAYMLRRINPKARIITDNPHSWNIPTGWSLCKFKSLINSPSTKQYQILQSEIKHTGSIPVISQSANFIEGYCDEKSKTYPVKEAVVIFGDHTRNVKYYEHPFVIGADGVKLVEWSFDRKFLFFTTLFISQIIPNKGYSRHFQYLANYVIGLPPFNEQKQIVAKIEELYAILDEIEASLQS